jgi:uncharacterized 2Fe-2S/4Fe-4S cluster protein (DUF4445 family)
MKHNVKEFFYDNSFNDYHPVLDREVLKLVKTMIGHSVLTKNWLIVINMLDTWRNKDFAYGIAIDSTTSKFIDKLILRYSKKYVESIKRKPTPLFLKGGESMVYESSLIIHMPKIR